MDGPALRKIRDQLGWTQAQMAEALAVTSTTVARWERGERAISKPMAKLIEAVCVSGKRNR